MKKTIIRIIAQPCCWLPAVQPRCWSAGAFPLPPFCRRERLASKKCFPPMSGWFMLATHWSTIDSRQNFR